MISEQHNQKSSNELIPGALFDSTALIVKLNSYKLTLRLLSEQKALL